MAYGHSQKTEKGKRIGNNIKFLLVKNRRTISDLSRGTGINYSSVISWTGGFRVPRGTNLERVANYFSVDKDSLENDTYSNEDIILSGKHYGGRVRPKRDILDEKSKFSSNLEYLMIRDNVDKEDLARLTGVKVGTIYSWLRGQSIPSKDVMLTIGTKFNESVTVLIYEDLKNRESVDVVIINIINKLESLSDRDREFVNKVFEGIANYRKREY